MTLRNFQFCLVAGVWVLLAGCRSVVVVPGLPPRDEGLTFFGPGRGRLERSDLGVIVFPAGVWRVNERDERVVVVLGGALAQVGLGRRLLVIGVGDDDVPDEHGRQLGVARAVEVRRLLVGRGGDPSLILVTGFAHGERVTLPWGGGGGGPGVEFAIVRGGGGQE